MSNPSMFRAASFVVVCLGFTGTHVAWADDAQLTPQTDEPRAGEGGPPRPDLYVEDPYAPHNTTGSEARLGTIVGFEYGQPESVLALASQSPAAIGSGASRSRASSRRSR